jgi:hypothetical protein
MFLQCSNKLLRSSAQKQCAHYRYLTKLFLRISNFLFRLRTSVHYSGCFVNHLNLRNYTYRTNPEVLVWLGEQWVTVNSLWSYSFRFYLCVFFKPCVTKNGQNDQRKSHISAILWVCPYALSMTEEPDIR